MLTDPSNSAVAFTYTGDYQVDRVEVTIQWRAPPWVAANSFPNSTDYFFFGLQSVPSGGTALTLTPSNFGDPRWSWVGCPTITAQSESTATYTNGANQEWILYRGYSFHEIMEAPMSFASGSELNVSMWWSGYPYWGSAAGFACISGRQIPFPT